MKNKIVLIVYLNITLIVSLPITLAATQSLVYDANGNLVTGDGKHRTYDGYNHLVQIRNGNNATGTILENLTWHPVEERILVKATYEPNGSWKENVYYISQSFVKVKNASGTYDFKYIYQNGQLVAQEFVGEKKHFMLNDYKGTVQVVVNESGAKVEETFYSPFGEIISGGATSRFDYEGKEYDSVVGDYDYHARRYCPSTHTFCQPDTMLPNVYDPQQLNRYAFEKNNPYKYVDEDGHIIWIPIIIATIAVIGVEVSLLALSLNWYNNAKELQSSSPQLSNAQILGKSYLQVYPDFVAKTFISQFNIMIETSLVYDDIQNINEFSVSEAENNELNSKGPKETDPELELEQLGIPIGNNPKIPSQGLNTITGSSIVNPRTTITGTQSRGGSGGGGRTSAQIAREEIKKAEEQGGSGEYKEEPKGGATWSTVTPRKKG